MNISSCKLGQACPYVRELVLLRRRWAPVRHAYTGGFLLGMAAGVVGLVAAELLFCWWQCK